VSIISVSGIRMDSLALQNAYWWQKRSQKTSFTT